MVTYNVNSNLISRKQYHVQGYKPDSNTPPNYCLVEYETVAKERRQIARDVDPLVPGQVTNPLDKIVEYIGKEIEEAITLSKNGISYYLSTEKFVGYEDLMKIKGNLYKIPETVHEDFLTKSLIPIVEYCNKKQEEENRFAESMAQTYKNNLIRSGANSVTITPRDID